MTVALVVGLFWLALPGQALLVVMVGVGALVGLGWRPRPRRDHHGAAARTPRAVTTDYAAVTCCAGAAAASTVTVSWT